MKKKGRGSSFRVGESQRCSGCCRALQRHLAAWGREMTGGGAGPTLKAGEGFKAILQDGQDGGGRDGEQDETVGGEVFCDGCKRGEFDRAGARWVRTELRAAVREQVFIPNPREGQGTIAEYRAGVHRALGAEAALARRAWTAGMRRRPEPIRENQDYDGTE